MKRKKLVTLAGSILLVLILVALSVGGCTSTAPPTTTAAPKTLRIGHLAALTEWFSFFDIAQEREVRAVEEIINEGGGITIGGERYNIEIVTEDFKSSLDGVAAASNKLVSAEQVEFVVGPMGFFSVASSPILEQYEILHVSTWNTYQPGEMDASTPYGFLASVGTIGAFVGNIEALQAIYPDVKNVAFIMPDDGQSPYVTPAITRLAEEAGYTIIGETICYPNEMTDFAPVAAKLNSIEGVDAFIQTNGVATQVGNITRSLRELGNYKLYDFIGPTNCADVLTVTGSTAGTNIMTGGYCPGDPGNPPIMNTIFDMLDPEYDIKTLGLWNANAVYVLVKVIEAAQSVDPAEVKAAWESMDTVDTIFGPGYVGGDETYGIHHHNVTHPISIQRLMDGEVFLDRWVEVPAMP